MQVDRADGSRRPPSPEELWSGIVAEIATMPDVVANLLREHRPDEQGFCTGNGCGTAGRGVPTTRWPCSLHTLATAAQGVLRGR
jgi:hypothetical protein